MDKFFIAMIAILLTILLCWAFTGEGCSKDIPQEEQRFWQNWNQD